MSKAILKLIVWVIAICSGAYIGNKLGHDVSLAIILLIASLDFIFWYKERGL